MNEEYTVISLFDGISCGREALRRAGINVKKYYAAEIDNHAISITKYNWSNTIHIGDVSKIQFWSGYLLTELGTYFIGTQNIILLMGPPCQSFSSAGLQKGLNDSRGELSYHANRILKMTKPKYYIIENVASMSKMNRQTLDTLYGTKSELIDSADFSAQMRKRLYWTNIEIPQYSPKNIILSDIIEHGYTDRDKSYCIDANYFKGGNLKSYFMKRRRQLIFEDYIAWSSSGRGKGVIQDRFRLNGKSNTLMTSSGCGNTKTMTIVYNQHNIRKLLPVECERLQTLCDDYTKYGNYNGVIKLVSNTQRYKSIGNGWTVDVIAHILKGII